MWKFAAKTSDHLRKYHPHSPSCPPTVVLIFFKMYHFNTLRIALIYSKLIGLSIFVHIFLHEKWAESVVFLFLKLRVNMHAHTHTPFQEVLKTTGQRHHSCCKANLTLCQVTFSTVKAGDGKCSLWSSTKLLLLMDWKFLLNFTCGQKNNIRKTPPSRKHICFKSANAGIFKKRGFFSLAF